MREYQETSDILLPLFSYIINNFTDVIDTCIFDPTDIVEVTTKEIYLSYLQRLPPPKNQRDFCEQDLPLTWNRFKSGLLSLKAKTYLYLIIHDKVGTQERGNRLMSSRFPSDLCPRCKEERKSLEHRIIKWNFVSESWKWLRSVINLLDSSTVLFEDISILH